MKKLLQEVAPRSARSAVPQPPVAGAVMSLDDVPGSARSRQVEESLERAVLPQQQAEEPLHQAVPSPMPPSVVRPEKAATKMIATPIDAQLRQRVRELRAQYEVSEAFVVETALRTFFGERSISDVAADLRARGGRLRRSR